MSLNEKREFYLLLIILFLTSTFVIWIRTTTVKKTYEYVQLEKEYLKIHEASRSERVEWLRITSPKKLEKLAKNLNLYPPQLSQVWKYDLLEAKE